MSTWKIIKNLISLKELSNVAPPNAVNKYFVNVATDIQSSFY